MEERFNFSRTLKLLTFILISIGLISLSYAILNGYPSKRILTNLLIDNFYFLGVSLACIFFISVQNLANSKWYICFKRVPEALTSYLPIAGVITFIVYLDHAEIYPWLYSAELKYELPNKFLYLNPGFFISRVIIYFLPWIILSNLIKRYSLKLDTTGNVKFLKQSVFYSSIFIVFFAITSSTSSWDWLMSLEPHWYSTLFGWYNFSGMFLSGVAWMALFIVFLKTNGYLKLISENHLNDLGKYIFSLSIFWAYLWYSQFFIIWYGNIPEEVSYFLNRLHYNEPIFYGNIILNFVLPFLLLLKKRFRQNVLNIFLASFSILIGRWIDLFLMIAPGVNVSKFAPEFIEIGIFAGFIGMFLLSTFKFLSKYDLIPASNPYFSESLKHV